MREAGALPAVLVVHNQYHVHGGEEQVVENEVMMLRDYGHTVHTYFRSSDELENAGVLRRITLPFTAVFSIRTYRAIRQMIRAHGIDIVHVHNTVGLVSPSVYYAAWSLGVPVVQTLHNFRLICPNGLLYRDDHVCEDCVHTGLRNAVRHGCYRGSRAQSAALSFVLWLHRKLGTWRKINAYIALTAFNRGKFVTLLPADRVHIKPNFIPKAPETASDAPRDGYAYVGRLTPEKGVWVLLEAFARMPDRVLTVAGEGPAEDAMRAYVVERRLSNVRIAGRLDRAGVARVMAGARALIMPTQLYEGISLAVLEAYACGTPVLGSDIGNVAALIVPGRTGYTFPPQDADALAACVRRFEASPITLPPDVLAPYSRETNYAMLLTIYREVLP